MNTGFRSAVLESCRALNYPFPERSFLAKEVMLPSDVANVLVNNNNLHAETNPRT